MSKAGQVIDGRFVLEEKISQGGVGAIWRATQKPHDRTVALKLLRPEMSNRPRVRRRFAREARAASRLSHANIASVYDFGVDDDGRMFIAMELIVGEPVSRCIETGLSLRNTLLLIDLLLAGLANAHARGVVHRDLKPDNILLAGSQLPDRLGVPKIVDFGIARVAYDDNDDDPRDTRQDEVVGTPRYMSPEQSIGERNLGPASDLYNVGLLLYELVTGEHPFGDANGLDVMVRHVHDPVPPIEPREGLEVPDELEELIRRLLEKEPRDRPSSAADVRKKLQPLIEATQDDPTAHVVPGASERSTDELTLQTVRNELSEVSGFELDDPTIEDVPDVWEAARVEVSDAAMGTSFQWVPFVGRLDERSQLQQLVGRIREDGRGCQILMYGEAGVGKTRLTMWLREHCEEYGLLRSHLGAFTRGGSNGLRGLQEVLEGMFETHGVGEADVRSVVRERLAEWGRPEASDAEAIVEFLRPHGRSPESGIQAGMPTHALFAAIVRVLEAASRHRPRLLILDDVHWAGNELADFLDYLAVEMRHRALPLLVISTIRTEDLSDRPELESRLQSLSRYVGETVERVELERLGKRVGEQLVHAILPCDAELTQVVYDRSGGNPLHLVLLLRYLREEGLLERDGEVWRATHLGRVKAAMPPSLADLFQVRVEQVEQRADSLGRLTDLLVRASIAGPRFEYDVLEEMIRLEGDSERIEAFDTDFDRVLAEGLLIEADGKREDFYQFSHGLLRDYFMRDHLGPGEFRKLHRIAAEAKERVHGVNAGQFALEIAAHWHAGRDAERALVWYGRAAKALRGSFMLRQSSDAYQKCMELMDRKLGISGTTASELPAIDDLEHFERSGVDRIDYLEMLTGSADLHEGFGEYDRAERTYRRVVRMVGKAESEHGEKVMQALGSSWLGLGHIAWQRGDFEAAEWAFDKARAIAESSDAMVSLEDDAARGLARVFWHRGEYDRAQELAEEALESARGQEDVEAEAEALWILGEVARLRGEGSAARDYYEASADLARSVDSPVALVRNLLSMAQLARYKKAFAEATDLYRRALRLHENLGDRRGAGKCYNGLGDIARFERRYVQAQKHYTRALDIYQSIGAEYDVAVVYTNLGLTAVSLDEFAAAERYLSAALSIVTGEEYPYLLAGIEFNRALVKWFLGEHQGSRSLLGKALERAERFPIPDLDYAEPLERLGSLYHADGDLWWAQRSWEHAANIYRELGLDDDVERVEAKIAEAFS
jgi:serine/threonine protein kinase/tetratricopeptide (TPR) repeat protein